MQLAKVFLLANFFFKLLEHLKNLDLEYFKQIAIISKNRKTSTQQKKRQKSHKIAVRLVSEMSLYQLKEWFCNAMSNILIIYSSRNFFSTINSFFICTL